MPRRRSSRSRRYRGGAGSPDPSSYSSASSYGVAVNGDTNAQYDRTFMGTGPAIYQGVQGQMTGGRRRRSRRGGFLGAMGSVVNQAIVPAALLGMQQTYRKRHNGGRKSRRYSRRRR
jgi:hypothetical protein